MTELGVGLLDEVANVVHQQLAIINSAFGTIQDFFKNEVIAKIPELTQDATALIASVLGRLFSLQTVISGLIKAILSIVFALIATLKKVLDRILGSVVSSLVTVLAQIGGCSSCLSGGLLGGVLGIGRRRRHIA